MAQFNFEGDLDNVTERQFQYINEVIKELGYENSKATFHPVGVAGDNYVANVKRIIVEGENGTLSIIAKIAPQFEGLRKMMNTNAIFSNEHKIYTEILPKLDQLQKDAGVPEKEQLRYAKCYGSLAEDPNEIILLEDLKTSDFTMLNRFESLSNECVKSVLRNFAIYHSLSYALRYKEPETYEHFKETMVDLWAFRDTAEEMKFFFQSLEDEALVFLEDPNHKNLVKDKIGKTMDISIKLAKADWNSKYNIILQGDAWTNNIMFKIHDENVDSIMIDYQQSRNANPVIDLLYMIFNCTDYETRKVNFYDWIDYYHSELDKALSNFNLKANFVYPRDKLDADLKRYGKLLFGFSFVLASMLIRKSDDAAKIKDMMNNVDIENVNLAEQMAEMSVGHLDEETINRFKTRILGLINSFTEYGLV